MSTSPSGSPRRKAGSAVVRSGVSFLGGLLLVCCLSAVRPGEPPVVEREPSRFLVEEGDFVDTWSTRRPLTGPPDLSEATFAVRRDHP